MTQVHIPTKLQIESRLFELYAILHDAATVAEIEDEFEAALSQLECDIANRAGVESGRIKQ